MDAYYVSINPEKVGSGSIKYRFMLGKDVELITMPNGIITISLR